MMYFIKILFLGISVLFSFGFTTYEANCTAQTYEKVEDSKNHSCCHPNKINDDQSKECSKSKNCKATCCLQATNIFVFNDFVVTTDEGVEKIKVFESIKHINVIYKLDNYVLNNYSDKIANYYYLNSKCSGRQIISLKQSWLI